MPVGGIKRADDIQSRLVAFEPVSEGDKILHAEALSQFTSSSNCASNG